MWLGGTRMLLDRARIDTGDGAVEIADPTVDDGGPRADVTIRHSVIRSRGYGLWVGNAMQLDVVATTFLGEHVAPHPLAEHACFPCITGSRRFEDNEIFLPARLFDQPGRTRRSEPDRAIHLSSPAGQSRSRNICLALVNRMFTVAGETPRSDAICLYEQSS